MRPHALLAVHLVVGARTHEHELVTHNAIHRDPFALWRVWDRVHVDRAVAFVGTGECVIAVAWPEFAFVAYEQVGYGYL